MNNKLTLKLAAALLLASALIYQPSTSLAQGTAFTYQGRLDNGGAPYSGSAEFQATLWNTASGGTALATNNPGQVTVGVTNGLFVLPLNFGANFPGSERWLELEVRTTIGAFNVLSPRQQLTPAPYAITASNLSGTLPAAQVSGVLPSANLAGAYSSALTLNNVANSFSGSGAELTALNAGELTSGTVPDARLAANVARTNQVWLLGGNAATTPGTHFLGTTDNQPLELKVNGSRALRLEPTANDISHSDIVNVIGGSSANSVGAGVYGATIGGGGALNLFSYALTNRVEANFGTVSGGYLNTIQGYAERATIGGGAENTIQAEANSATISGGHFNTIQFNNFSATIGGGEQNMIQPSASYATIGGGYQNMIQLNAQSATVSGGFDNLIQTSAYAGTIGGGSVNTIQSGAEYATIGGGTYNNIQPTASYATISGGTYNTIQTNAAYATIGGGYANKVQNYVNYGTVGGGFVNTIQTNAAYATIGGGQFNTIQSSASSATISGGYFNIIQTNAARASIGGGYQNTIQTNAYSATIGGGVQNTIQLDAAYATIGGGFGNTIQTNAGYGTIDGGILNTIQPNAAYAAIGGGLQNTIQPYAVAAAIPGGYLNSAASYAFAAGSHAKANHTGAFVWGDSQGADFASTAADQFCIRAAGGVRLSDSTPQLSFGQTVRQMITLYDSGVNSTFGIGVQGSTFYQRAGTGSGFAWYQGGTHNNAPNNAGGGNTLMLLSSGGLTVNGALVSSSDRNVKENFASVQPREMLEKVVALPLSSWNYKADTATRHVGPMAQDFYAAFNVGPDDKHIATVDADGVALAAIQGLNQKVEEREASLRQELNLRDAENAELRKAVAELKETVEKLCQARK